MTDDLLLGPAGAGLFELLPTGMFLCDADGRIAAVNAALAGELGVPADELVGSGLERIFADAPDVIDDALAMWQRSASRRPAGLTLRGHGDDTRRTIATGSRLPSTRTVAVQVRPHADATQEFTSLSREIELRDLRELRRRLQDAIGQLRRSNRRLTATNDELERYASMISHDLRTPISAISQFAVLLGTSDTPLTDEQEEIVSAIRRLADQASSVVSSLLRLARAGSFEDVPGPVDADAAVERAREQVGIDTHDDVAVTAGRLPKVLVHEAHLVQIMANLLGNAVRYRDPGEPLTISISAHEQAGWVRIVVSDDGPGVPESDRERIFAPNVRGSTVADDEGTGLGLAMCRRLVAGYGGHIQLLDDAGPGATFEFTVPGADAVPGQAEGGLAVDRSA